MFVSQQATCSRVGIPNMAVELTVSSSHNVRHIAETWLSHRKQLVYRIHRLYDHAAAAAAGGGGDNDNSSSSLIPQQTKCRHVDWYVGHVAKSAMLVPHSANPLHFGILMVSLILVRLYTVSQKTCHFFCSKSVKYKSISIKIGIRVLEKHITKIVKSAHFT